MKSIKDMFFFYQKMFWYAQQARNEISKPMGLYTEVALAILLLKGFGVQFAWWEALIAYIALLGLCMAVGYYLTVFGVVEYNTRLSNEQNPELQEILKHARKRVPKAP